MVHANAQAFSASHFQLHVTIKALLPSHTIKFKSPLLKKRAFRFWITFLNYFVQLLGFTSMRACCSFFQKPLPAHKQGRLSKIICSPMYTVNLCVTGNFSWKICSCGGGFIYQQAAGLQALKPCLSFFLWLRVSSDKAKKSNFVT